MSSDDESDLLGAARRADQQGGNPLFRINPQRISSPPVFRDGLASQHAVRFRLEQLQPPNGEYQGEAVSEAFRQGLIRYVQDNQIGPAEDLRCGCRFVTVPVPIRGPAALLFPLLIG